MTRSFSLQLLNGLVLVVVVAVVVVVSGRNASGRVVVVVVVVVVGKLGVVGVGTSDLGELTSSLQVLRSSEREFSLL